MFKIEKGNVPITAHKTETPIKQKDISIEIWKAIQTESGDEELGENNNVEFLIAKDDATGEYLSRFIKITKDDGQKIEFKASEDLCDLITQAHLGPISQN